MNVVLYQIEKRMQELVSVVNKLTGTMKTSTISKYISTIEQPAPVV